MGMAASQARLLSLTARMHDVEYKAQSIQNAKLALATQSDEISAEYLDALDATTLTLTSIDPQSGTKSTVAATFNNLFSKSKLVSATSKDYLLQDKYGRMVVNQDEYDAYYAFKNSGNIQNPQMFALFMLDINPKDTTPEDKRDVILTAESWAYNEFTCGPTYTDGTANNNYQPAIAEELQKLHDDILTILGQTNNTSADALYNTTNLDQSQKADYEKKLSRYQSLLYSTKGEPSCAEIVSNKINEINNTPGSSTNMNLSYDQASFNYYMNIFKQIEACGGCVSIEENNGFNGDAKNDSEWLRAMVESGLMTIHTVSYDKEGKVKLNGTSPSSDDNINYTTTTTIDPTALKKAEAKYESAMRQVNKKDKMFDMDLQKIDTERNALKTEFDQVKKVASDNIEKTFTIFS